MERSEFFIFSMFNLQSSNSGSVWVTCLGGNESHLETYIESVWLMTSCEKFLFASHLRRPKKYAIKLMLHKTYHQPDALN